MKLLASYVGDCSADTPCYRGRTLVDHHPWYQRIGQLISPDKLSVEERLAQEQSLQDKYLLDLPIFAPEPLYNFQKATVAEKLFFYLEYGMKGTYNGCDQGLGKTAQAIYLANQLAARTNVSRNLVISPASVKYQWPNEIRTWGISKSILPSKGNTKKSHYAPVQEVMLLQGPRDTLRQPSKHLQWIVTGYPQLLDSRIRTYLKQWSPSFIIFDEAYNLANPQAKRTQGAYELWNASRKGLFMAGTIIRRYAADLFPPLSMLLPEYFYDYEAFKEEYCIKRYVPWGNNVEYYGLRNYEHLKKVLRSNVYVRRIKEDPAVGLELPSKTWLTIEFDPIRKKRGKKDVGAEDLHFQAVEQSLGQEKIQVTKEWMSGLLEDGLQLLVFAVYRATITQFLNDYSNYNPGCIYGGMTGTERSKAIDDFNASRTPLLCCQIVSGGVGLNLQKSCHTIVFLESNYSASDVLQASDRVHRIGQKYPVTIYFPVVRGSRDELRIRECVEKARMQDRLLGEEHL